jgi:hypothetical protein
MEALFFIISSSALAYIIKNLEEVKENLSDLNSRVLRIEHKIPRRKTDCDRDN